MALEDFAGDFEGLRVKIDKQVTFLADHSKSHSGRVNLAASDGQGSNGTASTRGDDDDDDDESASAQSLSANGGVDLSMLPEAMQEPVLAMMRAGGDKRPVRMSNRGRTQNRAPQGPRPRARTPPQGSGEKRSRCGSCGAEDHKTPGCDKPMLDKSKRKCFDCGKEGHEARFCPKKKNKNTNNKGNRRGANVVEPGDGTYWAMMVRAKDDDGFERVGQRPITVADFHIRHGVKSQAQRKAEVRALKNTFACLADPC